MTVSILAALVKFGPWLLAGLGVLFGMFRHQQAKTATAEAGQKIAEAQAKTADVQKSEAESNAVAAQAGNNAAQERQNVETDIASGQPGAAADELRNGWSRD